MSSLEVASLMKVKEVNKFEELQSLISSHVVRPEDEEAARLLIAAVAEGGLVSKETMEVIGSLQRQGRTTRGLYRDIVVFNERIFHPDVEAPVVSLAGASQEAYKPRTLREASAPKPQKVQKVQEAQPFANTWRRGSRGFVIMEALRDGAVHTIDELKTVCEASGKPYTDSALGLVIAEFKKDYSAKGFKYEYTYDKEAGTIQVKIIDLRESDASAAV